MAESAPPPLSGIRQSVSHSVTFTVTSLSVVSRGGSILSMELRLSPNRARAVLRYEHAKNVRDKERPIRLRPRKPRADGNLHPLAKSVLWKIARGAMRPRSPGNWNTPRWSQKCVVKMRYRRNVKGKSWAAHGRYITRERAAGRQLVPGVTGMGPVRQPHTPAFDATREQIFDVPKILETWQNAGDAMHWRMILSPEFGAEANLEKLTRKLLEQTEKDLNTRLEWVAVKHYNTSHPHVHVVLRGVRDDGTPLRIDREYIKRGVRLHAEAELNRQLGLRKPGEKAKDLGWQMPPERMKRS